jgi:hypothetical protein
VGSILETNAARLGPAFLEQNVGMLTVDWEERTVRMVLLGSSGQTLLERLLSLDDLSP